MNAGQRHARPTGRWLSPLLLVAASVSACAGSGSGELTSGDAAVAPSPRAAVRDERDLIPQDAPRRGPVRTQDLAPLPEDEAAGKRSQEQWREHLEYEERERQMWFDKPRLAEHRALARQLSQARASYDAARSERALAAVEKQVQRRLRDLRERVARLDPWGVNSRLLPDYAQLFELLETDYPAAQRSALGGDQAALRAARERFDARLGQVAEWLEEVEHEHEAERER